MKVSGRDRHAGGSPIGLRTTLRSLSSASLAVGSAAAFLVLVTFLSFVPDVGTGEQAVAWQLRGSLPALDALPPARGRTTRQAAS